MPVVIPILAHLLGEVVRVLDRQLLLLFAGRCLDEGRFQPFSERFLRLDEVHLVPEVRQLGHVPGELRDLPAVAVVPGELDRPVDAQPERAPGHPAAVDLLRVIPEEGQGPVFRERFGQRADHLRGEVLPLVDHDVPETEVRPFFLAHP